ncbi:ParA family protein [Burkholderia ambifaria]|uniref:ParA family protein n=1 Tax=Burkholderia ambifaria TaxID=152480 RepID=UPI001B8E5AC8|nr:ParA family protein [Burkholderia ambifaria]MBR8061539.1 ParA family protein [Burkholderia ambifaria]
MPIVTLYNHKGGVSKTTTTFNLAHLLVTRGKKVLLVDADSQCNLTELCLGRVIEELDAVAEKTGIIQELPGTNILDALKPRIEGEVAAINIDTIETVNLVPGLDLIRGSVDLTSIEDDIGEAHTQRFAARTNLMRTYVAIGDMLTRLADARGYDYIFIDLGPSAGALTRSFFLACDAFFVPVAPDRFNVQAIRTLSTIVSRWLEEHSQIRETYKSYSLPVRPGQPIFCGAISQFFKVYKGKPKAGFDVWMKRIPEQITTYLVPALEKLSTPNKNLCPLSNDEFIAAQIPDFGTLAPLMQEVGKPVFSITQEDTALVTESGVAWAGGTWTDAQKRMATYKTCLEQLANRISIAG